MAEIYRAALLQDAGPLNELLSLYKLTDDYSGFYLTLREDFGDSTETINMNNSLGFIDDDATISDGVTTITEWLTASGATNAYIAQEWDQSGAGNHITQGTTADQPLLVLNGAGTAAEIEFDGDDDSLKVDITDYNSPSTIFIVYQRIGSQLGSDAIFASSDSFDDDSSAFLYSSNELKLSGKDSDGNLFTEDIEPSASTSISILSYTADGVSNLKGWNNGNLMFDVTDPQGFLGTYKVYKFGVNRTDIRWFGGKIFTAAIYNKVLNTTERQFVENKLMTIHGIS